MIAGADVVPDPGLADAVLGVWARLGAPGPTLTGAERVAVMADVRAAVSGRPTADTASSRAAARIGARPQDATAEWIDELEAEGLPRDSYVEIVGVASRTVAVDTFVRGLGAPSLPLPEAGPGGPTGRRDPGARRRSAYVPMVGPAWPPGTLSWLPTETAELVATHDALYLTMDQMVDMEVVRDLTRAQIELVAARTSWHNECFY